MPIDYGVDMGEDMSTDWMSVEDVISDLWSFSEIETPVNHDEEVATPAHILEYNARVGANNNRSIFDNPSPTEDVTFVFSGRGRGGRSTMIRPGAAPLPNIDSDVRRRLREVSGLGYSNELIEQSFKAATGTSTGISNTNIKLQPVPSTSSASSSRSTPSRKSRARTPDSSKKSSSSATTSSRTSATNLSVSSASSRSATPSDVAEIEFEDAVEEVACSKPCQPLPLSVMLNQAKRDKMKAKEDASKAPVENGQLEAKENIESDQNTSGELNVEAREWYPNGNTADNDYWWNRELEVSRDESNSWRRRDTNSPNRFFVWKKSKNFDISSSKEFPALK